MKYSKTLRWTDRIQSQSGDWIANVFDFFFRVFSKVTRDFPESFKIEDFPTFGSPTMAMVTPSWRGEGFALRPVQDRQKSWITLPRTQMRRFKKLPSTLALALQA
ncbi:MAG: hypothetical protein SOV58_00445 [Candidatus Enteromonas sp.]|nr:hypothetical protein [Candidatus Enteromonas sp.]